MKEQEVRPIDANELLADLTIQIAHHDAEALKHALSGSEYPEGIHRNCAEKLRWCERLIRNAPALQPEGDAISRSALLADFERYKANRHPLNNGLTIIDDCIANIKNFPALPVAAPGVDVVRVTAEEVVEGIEWHDGTHRHKVERHFENVASLNSGHNYSKKAIAAMLNAAESITWPEGHPRNPKPKEPTLLEAAEALLEKMQSGEYQVGTGAWDIKPLKAAIEREKEGRND